MSINYPSHIKSISIVFDENTSHAGIIEQLVEKLVKEGFSDKEEILEHLEQARDLIENV